MQRYEAQCPCGRIHFSVEGDPLFTQYCHCEKCREVAFESSNPQDKMGYSFTAAYLTKHFHITKGEDDLETLVRLNSNLLRCSHCKSLVYGISRDPAKQQGLGINMNNFRFSGARPDSFQPNKHIYYENRIIDIDDDLPKYNDAPIEQFGTGELAEVP